MYTNGLATYTAIMAPIARSIKALEERAANTADVYIFWLAITAFLQNLFTHNKDIDSDLAEKVTAIVNRQYMLGSGSPESGNAQVKVRPQGNLLERHVGHGTKRVKRRMMTPNQRRMIEEATQGEIKSKVQQSILGSFYTSLDLIR